MVYCVVRILLMFTSHQYDASNVISLLIIFEISVQYTRKYWLNGSIIIDVVILLHFVIHNVYSKQSKSSTWIQIYEHLYLRNRGVAYWCWWRVDLSHSRIHSQVNEWMEKFRWLASKIVCCFCLMTKWDERTENEMLFASCYLN